MTARVRHNDSVRASGPHIDPIQEHREPLDLHL
jgi:hypothetical protein